jgi:regulator of sirC expression with transglutaminase-like and TPR domain
MIELSNGLKAQCEMQETESAVIEADKIKVREDVEALKTRVHILLGQKETIEGKIEYLKQQNNQLETFLEVFVTNFSKPRTKYSQKLLDSVPIFSQFLNMNILLKH